MGIDESTIVIWIYAQKGKGNLCFILSKAWKIQTWALFRKASVSTQPEAHIGGIQAD